jgi:hypothetical protein
MNIIIHNVENNQPQRGKSIQGLNHSEKSNGKEQMTEFIDTNLKFLYTASKGIKCLKKEE